MTFTIMDACRVQRDLGLGDRHVAYIDPDEGFVMAHTDAERASHMILAGCEIHLWLADGGGICAYGECFGCFRGVGWYEITGPHEAKGPAL